MKAVIVRAFGGPEELRLAEVADPVPGPGEVRIAVRWAGINPVDTGNRSDGSWAGLDVPCILGYDVAGVIDTVGPGVTGLAPGDRVMAMTRFPDGVGGYAELVVVEARLVAPIDADVTFADAAATPLAAGTAHDILSRLRLSPGSKLLVLGASDGVGLFLLQMAAAAGISVVAAGRTAMHEEMLRLGAAGCIDHTSEHIAERAVALFGGQADAIADLVGSSGSLAAMAALRPGGQIAAISVPLLDLEAVVDANITFHGVLIQDDGNRTRKLAALLADGTIRPVISYKFPFERAAEAHKIIENGHAGGKIILRVAT